MKRVERLHEILMEECYQEETEFHDWLVQSKYVDTEWEEDGFDPRSPHGHYQIRGEYTRDHPHYDEIISERFKQTYDIPDQCDIMYEYLIKET